MKTELSEIQTDSVQLVLSASDFEKITTRLIRVLSLDGSEVKHNARITDRDTNKSRQVDILVSKGSKTIHYECRHHAVPQDVKWIEELIGRKQSLGADEMVGVSSSGFTGPALVKAKAHSIGLLDLREMSEVSILRLPTITYEYYHFKDVIVHFGFARFIQALDAFALIPSLKLNSYEVFEQFVDAVRDRVDFNASQIFWFPVCWSKMRRLGFQSEITNAPRRIHVSGTVCRERVTISVKSSYDIMDSLILAWVGSIHYFGFDGCHFLKTKSAQEFLVNTAILNLPQGAAMTAVGFSSDACMPVQLSGDIRDMRKPPNLFSANVTIEDPRETALHHAFQRQFGEQA